MAVLHNFSRRYRHHFSTAPIRMIYLVLLHSQLATVCLAFIWHSFTLILSVQYICFSLLIYRLITALTNLVTRLIV